MTNRIILLFLAAATVQSHAQTRAILAGPRLRVEAAAAAGAYEERSPLMHEIRHDGLDL